MGETENRITITESEKARMKARKFLCSCLTGLTFCHTSLRKVSRSARAHSASINAHSIAPSLYDFFILSSHRIIPATLFSTLFSSAECFNISHSFTYSKPASNFCDCRASEPVYMTDIKFLFVSHVFRFLSLKEQCINDFSFPSFEF